MDNDSTESNYELMEIFIAQFIFFDIIIIMVLLLEGPIYAVIITALLVVSVFLTWYLPQQTRTGDRTPDQSETNSSEQDPITILQNRYASGELSEAEFEAALDQLIDANEQANQAGIETEELPLKQSDE